MKDEGGDEMNGEISVQLAKFVVETKYPEIPEEAVGYAKELTLKTMAAVLAGSSHPSVRKLTKLIRGRRLPEDVGVTGCGFKTSLWEAIFLNSFSAHARELEDNLFDQGVSWDITVVPLLLSLAEDLRLSGKALTEALVIGLEVHVRTCLFPADHLGLAIVPGAVGPAAAAARALGLGFEQTASALGLAMSGVPLAILNFGTDAHYFESALQSLQGIMAAEMAKEGLTSNPDIGTYLANFLGKEKVVQEKMLANLGKQWLFRNIWIKKYPCCWGNHRAVDMVLELRKRHNLLYEELETIELQTGPSQQSLNRPEPKTVGDLQFSLQHIIGAAMLDGDIGLTQVSSDLTVDPKYKEARSKVRVVIHPEWPSGFLEAPDFVTIKMKDGREFSSERKRPIGAPPEEPLTREQFRELYYKFSRGILLEEQIERTAQAILNLEKLNDVRELMDILTFGPGRQRG
jgi:2-methylcitrate dehydratase PrpD